MPASSKTAPTRKRKSSAPSRETPTHGDAPKRRDAEENRAKIIQAARELFATSGFDAPLAEIAARSGVGRATLYRNFPDRFALAAAIFEDNLAALEALATAQRGRPEAFMALLAAMVEQQVELHAIFPALLTGPSKPNLDGIARRTKALLTAPLRAAVGAGLVRSDLTRNDVLTMLAMISAVVFGHSSVATRRRQARRALELLLHGVLPRAGE